MQSEHSFTVLYTEEIVRDAVRAFAWRRFVVENRGLWITAAGMVVLTLYLWSTGDRSWHLGLFAVVSVLPIVMLAAGWRAHFANSVGRFRRMRTPEARFALYEEGVTISAEDGDATVKWHAIHEVWRRPKAWTVFLGENQFFLMPTDGVPPDALQFFAARAGRPAP